MFRILKISKENEIKEGMGRIHKLEYYEMNSKRSIVGVRKGRNVTLQKKRLKEWHFLGDQEIDRKEPCNVVDVNFIEMSQDDVKWRNSEE